MKRLFAAFFCLILACGAGCRSTSSALSLSSPSTRPVVHDEHGAAVSELIFPPEQHDVVLPLRGVAQTTAAPHPSRTRWMSFSASGSSSSTSTVIPWSEG